MVYNSKFDDIRPYYEEEIPSAMKRIASSKEFPLIASYIFPEKRVEEVGYKISQIQTIEEFQSKVMKRFNEEVIKHSIADFSFNGLNFLQKNVPYLFVSNHRDIVLDSSLLQYVLFTHGFQTSEITFGANLMCSPLIIDIGKSNKMFRVERGGTPKEFYRCSKHLSEYIRYVIRERSSSVWIAQRNGRTKDGNDRTDQGIIKMFGLSKPEDKIEALSELNIVPVCVSYEWEPCDYFKAFELYISRTQKYIKRPDEDITSILTGITQEKGRVHFEICQIIGRSELLAFSSLNLNDFNIQVARIIDHRINSCYKLWPNNYIAHDLLHGQRVYENYYTSKERDAFLKHFMLLEDMAKKGHHAVTDLNALHEIFLGIYANPVDSRLMN